jgi:hypothetical protein
MKKTVVYLSLAVTLLVVVAAKPGRSSSGAPASHTGAPGEKSCAASGCHDDNAVNKGTAKLQLEIGEGITKYAPGQTYALKIKIADANKFRFGFQILALGAKTHCNMGTFTITDSIRTQLISNFHHLTDRQYVTYTFEGTDAVKEGQGEWYVNWTAPLGVKEPVTFYLAAVSANDDMYDKGDFVYTKAITIAKQ